MSFPVLETKRLIMRSISSCDIEPIYNCWMQDPLVAKYMWWVASSDINATKRFVETELENVDRISWTRWMLVEKESKKLIGTCLLYFNEELRKYDVSYNLGKEYWGLGYATEAMVKALEYGKQQLHLKEIYTTYAIENFRSARVLEKLGFKTVKEIPYKCDGGKTVLKGILCKCIL